MSEARGEEWQPRLAAIGDLPEIQVMAQASLEGPQWPADAWLGFLQPNNGQDRAAVLLLLRDRNERLCGWLAGTVLGQVAELEFLLVSPQDRRVGAGRSLLQAWKERAKEAGASEMFLEVRASNGGALALYLDAGFTVEGRRTGYYSHPREDALVMRLLL